MSLLKRYRTILATLGSTAVAQAVLAVSGIAAARILGVDARGTFALFNLLPTLLTLLGTCGLPVAITYFIARDPQHARATFGVLVRSSAVITLLLTLVDLIALAIIEHGRSATVIVAAAISIPLVASNVAQVLGQAVLQGEQRYRQFNVCRILPAVTYAIAIAIIFVLGIGNLLLVTIAFVVTSVVVAALTLWLAVAGLPPYATPPGGVVTIRAMFRFGLSAVLGAVYPTETFQLDQAAVGIFLSSASLGLYVISVSFTNLPRFIAQSFGMIAYPRVASQADLTTIRRMVVQFTLGGALSSLVTCLILEASVGILIPLAFGHAFAGAISVTRILLVSSFLVSVRRVLADALRGAGHPTVGTFGEAVAMILLLPLLAVLVTADGLHGAAIAMCCSGALGLSVTGVRSWRALRPAGANHALPDVF